jgi:hypothetical protein
LAGVLSISPGGNGSSGFIMFTFSPIN